VCSSRSSPCTQSAHAQPRHGIAPAKPQQTSRHLRARPVLLLPAALACKPALGGAYLQAPLHVRMATGVGLSFLPASQLASPRRRRRCRRPQWRPRWPPRASNWAIRVASAPSGADRPPPGSALGQASARPVSSRDLHHTAAQALKQLQLLGSTEVLLDRAWRHILELCIESALSLGRKRAARATGPARTSATEAPRAAPPAAPAPPCAAAVSGPAAAAADCTPKAARGSAPAAPAVAAPAAALAHENGVRPPTTQPPRQAANQPANQPANRLTWRRTRGWAASPRCRWRGWRRPAAAWRWRLCPCRCLATSRAACPERPATGGSGPARMPSAATALQEHVSLPSTQREGLRVAVLSVRQGRTCSAARTAAASNAPTSRPAPPRLSPSV
jgi:hypothetical protein